jgi:predicted DNA repair protein MutK
MPSGLAALLDDVATIAKLAAASVDDVSAAAGRAGMKAAGVVIDDTAVTPRLAAVRLRAVGDHAPADDRRRVSCL